MSVAENKSYWSIVRAQLAKNKVAMFGVWCVVFLFLLATYAPVIASDRPYFYFGPDEQSSPWLRDLFDHNEVSQPVDLFFNLLMLYLPLAAVVFWLVRRRSIATAAWRARRAVWTLVGLGAVNLWIFMGIFLSVEQDWAKVALAPGMALRSSKPIVDYHEKIAAAVAAGHDVTYLFPPAPYHYEKTRPREQMVRPDFFLGPTLTERGAVGKHALGTELAGKDVLTRLLYGTRISMTIGVIAVAIYCTIGIIVGSLAGYFGGWIDIAISRVIEIVISFPPLVFLLAVVSFFPHRSIFLIMVAIAVISWPGVARLVRGEFISQRGQDYVTAARGLGIPQRRIIFRHVLPNALTPVLVAATFGVAAAILIESTLSFLGLGDPTASSWGSLLNLGRHNTQASWLILAPGIAIFFTVTAFNLVGEGLRDALDPKLRQ